jgi:uncharacterized protein (DUF1330 family)
MPGYLVANVDVHDPALFEEYRKQVPAILAAHGGRYIVRGATLDHVEGKLPFKRMVVLEFPSVEAARRFYDSPEYAPVKKLRMDSARSDIAIVDGYAG